MPYQIQKHSKPVAAVFSLFRLPLEIADGMANLIREVELAPGRKAISWRLDDVCETIK